MSAVPAIHPDPPTLNNLEKIELRIVRTASELNLKDAPDPATLRHRLESVAAALRDITEDLRWLIHLSTIDHEAMEREAADLDRHLRDGDSSRDEPSTCDWLASMKAQFG